MQILDTKQSDFKYFIDNHDDIFSKYPNKYVVIKDQTILYAEDTFDSAFEKAITDGLEVGSFLIQECTEGDSAYTQTYHSRVIFA